MFKNWFKSKTIVASLGVTAIGLIDVVTPILPPQSGALAIAGAVGIILRHFTGKPLSNK